MARFTRVDRGMELVLEAAEVEVLSTLAGGLATRLEGSTGSLRDDDILRLLAPDVSRGDRDVDAELRAMLHPELLTDRATRLRDLTARLADWRSETGDVRAVLDRDAAMRVVEALNDLRLALAATVGLDAVDRADLEEDPARADTLRLLDALAWLQGGLIEFVDND